MRFAFAIIVLVCLTACGRSASKVPDISNLVETAVAATVTAIPAATPYPTYTLLPTYTPVPTYNPVPSSTFTATPRFTLAPVVTSTPEDVVELVDWTWYSSQSGNYFYVDGVLKNVSNGTICYVELTILLLDANEKLLATDSGYADMTCIGPGEDSTFKIMTASDSRAKWVKITGIQWRNR